jgi:uncharacterized protein YndB with AHSA1/START domain
MREAIVRKVTLEADPEEVWDALVEPRRLGAWFGAEVELEPRTGAPIAFRMRDGGVRRGVVERAEPPRRLAFRWRPVTMGADGVRVGPVSRVAFELTPAPGGGTTLTVRESAGLAEPGAEALAGSGGRR